MLQIHQMLATQNKSRLVGANAPGIISAVGKCRIGFQPLMTYSPGPIGVVAKSGTLSYETVASLTRAGMGQSICIGMGGDVVAGTDFIDALKMFEADEDTEGIVLVGEVGGTAEEEAAPQQELAVRHSHSFTFTFTPVVFSQGRSGDFFVYSFWWL